MRRPLLRWLSALSFACLTASSAAAFDPWQDEARYELVYEVALDSIPVQAGERVGLWVPLPGTGPDQRLLEEHIDAPFPPDEHRDQWGNRMAYFVWTGPLPDGSKAVLTSRVARRPSTGTPQSAVEPGSPDDPQRHLRPAKRVPLDGLIAQLGAQEAKGHSTDAEKIRAFYDYVVKNMRYSKEGEGWGQGDAVWACTSKYGNCTDFHSVFLGMARSQGIPTRFVMGFPVPPSETSGAIAGYHCWAEAWDPTRGWVPLDASEAWKAKRFDDYFGKLPSDRIAFTMGRDLVLSPVQKGPPLNYFIHPYAEIRGRPFEEVEARYSFRRIGAEAAAR